MVSSCAFLAASVLQSAAQSGPSPDPVALAQRQITRYVSQLADLHCTETVTQQKLGAKEHIDATERSKFDYLIMMNGTNDDFQLNESRIASPDTRQKLVATPMLITNGIATVLLVFHPFYIDGFNFEAKPEEIVAGKPAIPIHFAHISDRRTPAALALRGREYPLELEGTAWFDKASGAVIRVDASLMRDMSDVGLRSLDIHVEYKPVALGTQTLALPAKAVVDVTTPKQHWRNTHEFESYKSFSTDAEQDPNFKLHPNSPERAEPNSSPQDQKEQQ
jgi:hypothetical protein